MTRMLIVVAKVLLSCSPSVVHQPKRTTTGLLVLVGLLALLVPHSAGFTFIHRARSTTLQGKALFYDDNRRWRPTSRTTTTIPTRSTSRCPAALNLFPPKNDAAQEQDPVTTSSVWQQRMSSALAVGLVSVALLIGASFPAMAENELSAKYGGGLDTSLVDQQCLLNKCNLQAKACLQDDASCRKGLTCTAKCLGDNACITGCMARYGNEHLDQFLKCTIEDHECIKVAILPGGFDATPPAPPAPVLTAFDPKSMTGSWFKVMGFNPNYDCYAHQRNSFAVSSRQANSLEVDVEFSMPRLLPDGIALPVSSNTAGLPDNMALNSYATHELMVFDDNQDPYGRSAHSHGEMFGLQFWENWYFIGENDKDANEEFKFVYYNGKTRQNNYNGAFVYARTEHLSPASMEKVYRIAESAGLNPNQFCQVQNAGMDDVDNDVVLPYLDNTSPPQQQTDFWRGLLASTRVSELLGVEPVAARDTVDSLASSRLQQRTTTTTTDQPIEKQEQQQRAWWYEAGDYLENPHRHFQAMEQLRVPVEWPQLRR